MRAVKDSVDCDESRAATTEVKDCVSNQTMMGVGDTVLK